MTGVISVTLNVSTSSGIMISPSLDIYFDLLCADAGVPFVLLRRGATIRSIQPLQLYLHVFTIQTMKISNNYEHW